MAVTKVKLKRDDCKGENGDVCNIKPTDKLGFTFDKCETCLGVFNYKKNITEEEQVITKERKIRKPKNKQLYIQTKLL